MKKVAWKGQSGKHICTVQYYTEHGEIPGHVREAARLSMREDTQRKNVTLQVRCDTTRTKCRREISPLFISICGLMSNLWVVFALFL